MVNEIYIREFIFDLEIDKEDKFQEYYQTLSAFVTQSTDALEKSFLPYQGNNLFIESLEIELEGIELQDFDSLKNQLIEKLKESLSQQIPYQNSRSIPFRPDIFQFSIPKLLEFIVEFGFYPWPFNSKEKLNNYLLNRIDKEINLERFLETISQSLDRFKRANRLLETRVKETIFQLGLESRYDLYVSQTKLYDSFQKSINRNENWKIQPLYFDFRVFESVYKYGSDATKILHRITTVFVESHQLSVLKLKEELENLPELSFSDIWKKVLDEINTQSASKGNLTQLLNYNTTSVPGTNLDEKVPEHLTPIKQGIFKLLNYLGASSKWDPELIKEFIKQNLRVNKPGKAEDLIVAFITFYGQKKTIHPSSVLDNFILELTQKSKFEINEKKGVKALFGVYDNIDPRDKKIKQSQKVKDLSSFAETTVQQINLKGLIKVLEGLKKFPQWDSNLITKFILQTKASKKSLSSENFIDSFLKTYASESSITEIQGLEQLLKNLKNLSNLGPYESAGIKKITSFFIKKSDYKASKQSLERTLTILLESVSTSNTMVQIFGETLTHHPRLLERLTAKQFGKLLNLFAKEKLSYPSILRNILGIIPVHKRKKYNRLVQIVLFKWIRSRNRKSTQAEVYGFLLNILFEQDRQLIPEKFQSTDQKTRDFLLHFIQNYPNQTSTVKTSTKNEQEEVDHFDYLLNLSNAFDAEDFSLTKEKKEKFIRLSDILANAQSFLNFLETYKNESTLLYAFTRLSLQKAEKKKFERILTELNTEFLKIEKYWIDLNSEHYLIDLAPPSLTLILRYSMFTILRHGHRVKDFNSASFTLNFLMSIPTDVRVYLDKFKVIIGPKNLGLREDIRMGIEAFLDQNKYREIPPNQKSTIFYKDYYYTFLSQGKIPFWKDDSIVDPEEIELQLDLSINLKDGLFLKKLMLNENAIQQLIPLILKKSIEDQLRLLSSISSPEGKVNLIELLKFSQQKLGKSSSEYQAISNALFQLKLWNLRHWDFIAASLKNFFEDRSEIVNLISSFEDQKNLSRRQEVSAAEIKQWTDEKILATLHFYIQNGTLIPPFIAFKESITIRLKEFLRSGSKILDPLMEEYFRLSNKSHLTHVFDWSLLIEIVFNRIGLSSIEQDRAKEILHQLYSDPWKQPDVVTVIEKLYQKFIFEDENKAEFLPYLLWELQKSSDAPAKILIEKEPQWTSFPDEKFPSFELESGFEEVQKELDVLKYYVELGSAPIDIKPYESDDYLSIIAKLRKAHPLLLQKNMFRWAKESKTKLIRLVKLYQSSEKSLPLLDLIVQGLSSYLEDNLDFLKSLLPDYWANQPNEEFKKELLLEYFSIWSRTKIFVDGPVEISSSLVLHLWKPLQTTKSALLLNLSELPENLNPTQIALVREIENELEQPPPRTQETIRLQTSEDFVKEVESGITINNAGLIIVWPFLSTLFSKLNLLENQGFKDDFSTQKAILATQYLVQGNQDYLETELMLNKILCGVALDYYIDTDIKLTENELGICDMALKAVVQQWEQLKTVASLREFFLQREGVLQQKEMEYNLRVKEETRDILVKFISWNLSIIKTTLMETRLVIFWKY